MPSICRARESQQTSLPLPHHYRHILLRMPRYLIGQDSLIGFVSKPFRIVLVPDARDVEVADRHGEYRFELQLSQLLADAVPGA